MLLINIDNWCKLYIRVCDIGLISFEPVCKIDKPCSIAPFYKYAEHNFLSIYGKPYQFIT